MGIHRRPQALRHLAVVTALLLLAACRSVSVGYNNVYTVDKPDDTAVCNFYKSQTSRQEVVAGGTITRILGTRAGRSGAHEGFLVKLSSVCDLTVRVETNVDLTGPVPIERGEVVTVKGEYEYYPLGGVIHWTHRDPRGRHEGGYVISHGKLYQ